MTTDYTKLRQLALAATPGPWHTGTGADAAYISAANPQTMLVLLDEIERLRKDAERYRWLRRQFIPFNSSNRPRMWIRNKTQIAGSTFDAAIDAAMQEKA